MADLGFPRQEGRQPLNLQFVTTQKQMHPIRGVFSTVRVLIEVALYFKTFEASLYSSKKPIIHRYLTIIEYISHI